METLLQFFAMLLVVQYSGTSELTAPASPAAFIESSTFDLCNHSDAAGINRQCSKDCLRILICNADQKLISTITCGKNYPSCSEGKCVKDMPDSCKVANIEGVCPGTDGYYPDAKDCYKYYYCDSDQKATASYQCPTGFPFNMNTNQCLQNPICGTINCNNKQYATNPSYPRLGALCDQNEIIEGTYVVCPISYELDDSYSCSPKCRKTGLFPDAEDERYYYRCLPSGSYWSLELTRMRCPGDFTFDPEKLVCQ